MKNLFLMALFLVPLLLLGQRGNQLVQGEIIDQNGHPVFRAKVSTVDGQFFTRTNIEGKFAFEIQKESRLKIEHPIIKSKKLKKIDENPLEIKVVARDTNYFMASDWSRRTNSLYHPLQIPVDCQIMTETFLEKRGEGELGRYQREIIVGDLGRFIYPFPVEYEKRTSWKILVPEGEFSFGKSKMEFVKNANYKRKKRGEGCALFLKENLLEITTEIPFKSVVIAKKNGKIVFSKDVVKSIISIDISTWEKEAYQVHLLYGNSQQEISFFKLKEEKTPD